MNLDKCDLCNSPIKEPPYYDGTIWYHSDGVERRLCRECYNNWLNSKEHKSLRKKYKKAKPCTELWEKMCKEEQTTFDKWFESIRGR